MLSLVTLTAIASTGQRAVDPSATEIDGLFYKDYVRYQSVQLVGFNPDNIASELVIPVEVTLPSGFFFPQKVQVIAEGALQGAPIKSVVFPEKCTTIGARALADCSSLETITIPMSVKSVGAGFADGCTALNLVRLEGGDSSDAISLGNAEAKALASGAYTLYMGRPVNFSGVAEESPFANDALKQVIYAYPYSQGILAGVFQRSTALTTVTFAKGITSVCAGTFKGCPELKNITFSGDFATINSEAFANCPMLTDIDLPLSITTIGSKAFADIKMNSVSCMAVIPPSLADDAFSSETYAEATLYVPVGKVDTYRAADGWKQFANIKETENMPVEFTLNGLQYYEVSKADKTVRVIGYDEATLPAHLEMPSIVQYEGEDYTVTEISQKALNGAPVKYLRTPSSVTTLPRQMLLNCAGLETLVIPGTVTEIGGYFNHGCTNLSEVTMEPGEGLINLGTSDDRAFYAGAFTLHLKRQVALTGTEPLVYSPFERKSGLVRLVVYPEAGDCRYLFYRAEKLTEAEFEEGCTTVGTRMFRNSEVLNSVKLPSTLTSIEADAFSLCSALKSIVLPESLESIESSAFEQVNFESVECLSRIPPTLKSSAFNSSTYANATLTVPEGMAATYAEADGWKQFNHIVEKKTSSNVVIGADSADITVIVADMYGRVLYNGPRESMPELPNGIYIMKSADKARKIVIKREYHPHY